MAYATREVVASAARTVSGDSGVLQVGGSVSYGHADTVSLAADVTAVTGTSPSMALSVEWSLDGGTTFAPSQPADDFTAFTGAGRAVKLFEVKAPTYRLVWALTGTTPSFTFSVREYADVD